MNNQTLFSSEQVAAIAAALISGFGLIATVIRWAVIRLVKAIDDGNDRGRKAIEDAAAAHGQVRERLVELAAQVKEVRADVRDARSAIDSAIRRAPQSERRHRAITDPAGFPVAHSKRTTGF